MLGAITSLLGLGTKVVESVNDYNKAKIESKTARVQAETDIAKQAAQNTADWERLRVWDSINSSKDEAVLYVFLAVFVANFIPWTQDYVLQGFQNLAATPMWFQLIFGAIILACFGLRGVSIVKGLFK